MLVQVLPLGNGDARAVYRLTLRAYDKSPDGRCQLSQNKADADGKDAAAHAYIKVHQDQTVKALIAGLAELGIKRGPNWVTESRLAARGCGSKVT
jgi:hypothetical protein